MKDSGLTHQYPLIFVERFRGRMLFNVPMAPYTSFGIGGPADVMAFPVDEADLAEILRFASRRRFSRVILGMGTNILVRDGGYRGIVINMRECLRDRVWNEKRGSVVAGAGVRTGALAAEAAERGLSGLEFASSIPGTVGGAAVMNAGAYGSDMASVVEGVEVLGPDGGRRYVPAREMGFSYRATALGADVVVTRVHLCLKRDDPERIRHRMREYASRRKSSAPAMGGNAGSVFKNPEGDSAGRLIEEAGFKGVREGGAVVSQVHANYIVNTAGARASDVLRLMARIRDGVYSRFGVLLEPEVRVIGEDG